ncbi:MAG TPA: S8 family peptidase [Candidatus Limnocylindrales bacterium]|nr:S8 family peptidase [Candidatus Limnocylindrales bacterium]
MFTRLTTRRLVVVVALATATGGLAGVGPAMSVTPASFPAEPAAAAPAPPIRYADLPTAVPDSYIVVLKPGTRSEDVVAIRNSMVAQYGGTVGQTYTSALQGFSITTTATNAEKFAGDARTGYVAQNQEFTLDALGVQNNPPSYGIDRIDQRSLPLDNKYFYPNTASSVWAFVIDTGIRLTHQEFGGQAFCGFDPWAEGCTPCNQFHGTHVAGTLGGATVGVAKGVKIVSVRVFRCSTSTSADIVIAGVDYVTLVQQTNPGVRMVANMSLSGPGFQPIDDAVTASITANVHYSVSAGNGVAQIGRDVCTYAWGGGVFGFSPARTPRATTVAATDSTDTRPAFSNIGACVDDFAPGVSIYSAVHTADNAYGIATGTSMSSPHSAGTAALWRQKFPADNADAVHNAINANATPGVVINPGAGSPNRLLFMGMIPV